MAISKQRIYKKHGNGAKDYTIIHPETSSDIVMRPNGYSLEDAIVALVKRVDVVEKNCQEGSSGSGSSSDTTEIEASITSMKADITQLQEDLKKLSRRVTNLEGFSLE